LPPEIFKEISFDYSKVISHVRQQAYLVKGLKITLVKQRDNLDVDTFYDRKMKSVIKKIKDQNTMIDDKIRFGWNSGDPV
jgi:DNA gyrase/topoisomerase IV subunit B